MKKYLGNIIIIFLYIPIFIAIAQNDVEKPTFLLPEVVITGKDVSKLEEITTFKVDLVPELTSKGMKDPIFTNLENPFKVFQWHGETFTIPPLGEWVATSETCRNQALRFGNAYGFQFHLEFTPKMVKDMLDDEGLNGDDGFSNKILDQFNRYYPEIKKSCYIMFENFLKLISISENEIIV